MSLSAINKKMLLIEDDPEIVSIVKEHVAEIGFEGFSESNGETGLNRALDESFDFIILDLQLPGLDGIEICKTLRKAKPDLPIIMLTSKADEIHRVLGLELGADDYITKPFSPAELKARIKAVVRRITPSTKSEKLVFGELSIDLAKRKIWRDKEEIELTSLQFDIVALLASQPGRPISRDELNRGVFGYEVAGFEQSISTHMSRIRSKIEPDPANPKWLKTVRGVGYCFADLEDFNK